MSAPSNQPGRFSENPSAPPRPVLGRGPLPVQRRLRLFPGRAPLRNRVGHRGAGLRERCPRAPATVLHTRTRRPMGRSAARWTSAEDRALISPVDASKNSSRRRESIRNRRRGIAIGCNCVYCFRLNSVNNADEAIGRSPRFFAALAVISVATPFRIR